MRANISLVVVWIVGCASASKERPHRGVVWTDGDQPVAEHDAQPSSRRERTPQRVAPTASEPYVPRLRCNDGTLSAQCSRLAMDGDCCANHGGVHRDPWGNLVFE